MATPLSILIAEDSENDVEMVMSELRLAGFEPSWQRVETEPDFMAGLATRPDIVLSDFAMPRFSGLRAADLNRTSGLDIPFILISGTMGEDTAVEAMKRGATDYFLKDRLGRLGVAVEQALAQKKIRVAQKQAEAALRLFRTLIDRSNDGIEVCDPETGFFLDVNETACERLGYTRQEMLALRVTDIEIGAQDMRSWQERVKEIRRMGATTIEGRQLCKDGSTFPVEVNVRHVMLDREYLIASVRDITERQRSEETLRESEERFRQLAENIDEVFWITNPDMTELIYVSPAYEKIWGRTCASRHAAPIGWLEAVHPEDRDGVAQAATNLVKSGIYDVTYRIHRPDKSERWIHDRGYPVRNAAGDIYRMVGTAEDMTEKRRLEEQFRQAQKMESIGQLAGGIAHDFNNILTAMVGNVYLIQMDAGDNVLVLNAVEEIAKATERAKELVKQILTFSRQGKQERGATELNPIVLEALKLLRASVPSTIRMQTDLSQSPAVLANATAIHQLIMNLGTNAWHAMRDQPGILKIETRTLTVDEALVKELPDLRPGQYVQLSVSDTGCGMDRSTLERIFEPFFTTKKVGEGTGLGLAVVHGIMKSHDGGISVHSQPGAGTTFHLYFPVIETEAAGGKIEAAPLPRGQGEHILFVDDEAALAGLGKKMLERMGYVVTSQTNPLEALTAVRDQPGEFDLVITDLTMPGMDGSRLGSQMLQWQPNLPIILMTGFSSVMTTEKVRELGFRELLFKPCDANALGEAVRRALQPAAAPKT